MGKKKDNAKPEDKAVSTDVKSTEETKTKQDYFDALKTIGLTPPAKTVKGDLEKMYNDNLPAIELMVRLPELKKACLVKAFGDHGSSGICPKCKKKQSAVYSDCSVYKDILGNIKTSSKKDRKMGHVTGTDLWGTRKGKYNNKFCYYLLEAADKGITMGEAKKADFNPKGYAYNETLSRLLKTGLVEKRGDRYYVTKVGIEQAEALKETKKAA